MVPLLVNVTFLDGASNGKLARRNFAAGAEIAGEFQRAGQAQRAKSVGVNVLERHGFGVGVQGVDVVVLGAEIVDAARRR